eukprot:GEMP01091896.1.p2 GENE.GEMP01091896.1~~GEMP01091896.1.p2  ORF type:complete len:106 (-),score=3.46 GEMP01091896.1:475-792(-)
METDIKIIENCMFLVGILSRRGDIEKNKKQLIRYLILKKRQCDDLQQKTYGTFNNKSDTPRAERSPPNICGKIVSNTVDVSITFVFLLLHSGACGAPKNSSIPSI